MTDRHDKSLMRSLGEFVGHIVRGVKAPVEPTPPERRQVNRTVEEETRDTPNGKVTLRRTTIEEVEFRPDESRTSPDAGPRPGQE
jgi:hypothetical protein